MSSTAWWPRATDRTQAPSCRVFHPGGDPRRPRHLRADLDGDHDGSGRGQRVDLPRAITPDTSEYVLAFSGYHLDRHIQYRLPDGGDVYESSAYRQHRHEPGDSLLVPHRLHSGPHPDRHAVCPGDERRIVFAATIAAILVAGIVQILVHLHYFLHLDTTSAARWNEVALMFTILILTLFVGGSLWIMLTLNYRMM